MKQHTPTDFLKHDQSYEARGIVARISPIGHYDEGLLTKQLIYGYLTLDCGPGKKAKCVRFMRECSWIDTPEGRQIDGSSLQVGEIIVSPGFVYKETPFTGTLMAEHLKAMKTYRRKVIITQEVDKSAGPIDVGTIDPLNLTKQ